MSCFFTSWFIMHKYLLHGHSLYTEVDYPTYTLAAARSVLGSHLKGDPKISAGIKYLDPQVQIFCHSPQSIMTPRHTLIEIELYFPVF